MSTSESEAASTASCPWCNGTRAGGRTVTVGPPPHLGDAHAFEMHVDCVHDWQEFVARARQLASAGARQTLLTYPLENGIGRLVETGRGGTHPLTAGD
ncbi:hypothetical protein [Halorubellus salinus]|uniref:hypothetical protein n=1 Tax=Halorubellus salinus TaxID=755309 RepID=UPI001D05F307|nr:hypothetical protein [Halorubellus salinus]